MLYDSRYLGYVKVVGTIPLTITNNKLVGAQVNNNNYTYAYSYNGLRSSKSINNTIQSTYYENNQLVFELRGDIKIYYLYNTFNDIIGYRKNNDYYYYIKDILGVINKIIDSNGNVVGTYSYTPYGELITTSGTEATFNSIRYKSYYYDVETNLYYCNTRYYNPEWGRWISPDTSDYLDSESTIGLNLYAYCGNNPVMYVDPSGHMPEWLKWTISGVTLVGLGIATIITGGATTPILLGAVGGSISGLISGITFDENGLGFDSNKASTGVMLGMFVGSVSGGVGSAISSATLLTSASMSYRAIMAGVDGLLGLGNYIGQNAINGSINQISWGGLLISFGSGLLDFCEPISKVFDAIWTPAFGAEIGWEYDLVYPLFKKRRK